MVSQFGIFVIFEVKAIDKNMCPQQLKTKLKLELVAITIPFEYIIYICYTPQYINSYKQKNKYQKMQEQPQIQRVKILTLKDTKNNEQQYLLSQKILGKGRFGKVYKATHIDNPDKVFAVKAKQEYLKQLQIIKHLPKCLNLVQIHFQHLESKNNFYLFQEFCNGGDLYIEKINRKGKPYTEDEVYNLFFQIVNGFLELRRANVFHQDIKPQNILIKNNIYKLADFGISQLSDKIQVSQIRKGTLVYMPPEKLKGSTYTPTSKSQIFSLGITLYQVIFGTHPYLKKKPQDYKQYLKLIQESQPKSLQQLKNFFPSRSLCIDRLIRTILKMIQLNQSKRLSLEQLQDYVTKTQPFQSMVVTELEPIAKKKEKPVKYQEIGRSNIIVRSQNGIGNLLVDQNRKQKQKMEKQKKQDQRILFDMHKILLELLRNSSSYLQQGLLYCKESSFPVLKKPHPSQTFSCSISPIVQLQFLCLFTIEKIFTEFQRSAGKFVIQLDRDIEEKEGKEENWVGIEALLDGIENDKEFIKNQFLKFFMDVQVEDKKQVISHLKQIGNEVNNLIIQLVKQIFSNICSVRINFKQDILSYLFLKSCPKVVQFLSQILTTLFPSVPSSSPSVPPSQLIVSLIDSPKYEQVKNILLNFSSAETTKKQKLRQLFQLEMKENQVLEDDQSNSDQFQILDVDAL